MDDSALTRLAIEEIVREMQENKELELQSAPTTERKINPLARPNKRFLGRTLKSVLTHNKREVSRTRKNCKLKLMELEQRRKKKVHKQYYNDRNKYRKEPKRRSESSHEVFSSNSNSSSTSSSSIRCSSPSSNDTQYVKRSKNKSKNSKIKKRKLRKSREKVNDVKEEEYGQQVKREYEESPYMENGYIADNSFYTTTSIGTNVAYVAAAAAFNQMLNYHQQQAFASCTIGGNIEENGIINTSTNTKKIENRKKRRRKSNESAINVSDSSNSALLSFLSYSASSSSLSISITSSVEEDENGVLTINLSSPLGSSSCDDDNTKNSQEILDIDSSSTSSLIREDEKGSCDKLHENNKCIILDSDSQSSQELIKKSNSERNEKTNQVSNEKPNKQSIKEFNQEGNQAINNCTPNDGVVICSSSESDNENSAVVAVAQEEPDKVETGNTLIDLTE